MSPVVPPPDDTTPEAWAAQIEVLRRMGGAGRSAAAFRLTALARESTRSGIRRRHPGYSDGDVRRAFFRLMHGDAAAAAAWPGRPLLDP